MRFTFRIGMLATLLAAHCSLVAQTASAHTNADGIEPIASALQAGQFDKALEYLQPELEQNPKNAQLWTLQGIAFSGKGKKKEALGAFLRALQFSPDYLPALEGAAQIEYENDSKDTAAMLQHILELHPGDPTSHAMLAVLAYRRGDCTTAVSHFEQSGSLLDSQPAAFEQYGDCLVRLKQTEKAITVFEHALDQSPNDVNARYRLASVQLIAERPKDAIAALQPLLQNQTADPDVLELAAAAYEADQNTPEAVRILRQAIISDPHNVDLYVDFATLSLDHQSFQVGVDMVDAGLEAEPKAAPLYVARGILYVQLAQYDKAEADFEKADALDPRQSFSSAAEGLAALEQNDPARALATVQEKLAQKPNDAILLDTEAELLAQQGAEPGSAEFQQAVKCAEKAISLRPSLGTARDLLAKLYLQSGQNEAAVEQSRKALEIDPKDQAAIYHLIQGLRKSPRQDEIPDLLKRLAALRMEGTKEENERHRYKLVEQARPLMDKQQP
ncbi:MAG: tetratricopeptide repeat protein [Terracidiphilus sp.]